MDRDTLLLTLLVLAEMIASGCETDGVIEDLIGAMEADARRGSPRASILPRDISDGRH